MRICLLLLVIGLVNLAACRPEPTSAPDITETKQATKKNRLVVVIAVDQYPQWSFEKDIEHFRHGLARIAKGRRAVAQIPYGLPLTGPGHAAIGTGKAPNETGVVANKWFQGDGIKRCIPRTGHPAENLMTTGLSTALRQKHGAAAKSIAIAGKSRAAAFMAGKDPDVALWYERRLGTMTTRSVYRESDKPWVKKVIEAGGKAQGFIWQASDEKKLAAITEVPDDNKGEATLIGIGPTFPHDMTKADDPLDAFRYTPAFDEMVAKATRAAIVEYELGQDDVPDLLAVSFSAHDYAGHHWGQESWERHELILKLDEQIGQILDLLDKRVGREHYAVVFTSDHGATRLVEHSEKEGVPGERVQRKLVVAEVQKAIAKVLGQGDWVRPMYAPMVYLNPKVLGHPKRQDAINAAVTQLKRHDYILDVIDTSKVVGKDCSRLPEYEELVCLSAMKGRTGDLFVIPTERSWISNDYKQGTHHSAPYLAERTVPFVVEGATPASGDGGVVSSLQIAPTIANLLGVSLQTGRDAIAAP